MMYFLIHHITQKLPWKQRTEATLMNYNHLLKVQKILLIQLVQGQTHFKDYQMTPIPTSVHTGNFSLLLLYLNCTTIQRI